MKKYDINIKRLIKQHLPFALRKGNLLKELLFVLLIPIRKIYAELLELISSSRKEFEYNSQYCYLQKLLNDRFDKTQREIEVYEDEEDSSQGVYVYKNVEKTPLKLGVILLSSHTRWKYSGFIVAVPAYLQDKIIEIESCVNRYKFAGTKYKIIIK